MGVKNTSLVGVVKQKKYEEKIRKYPHENEPTRPHPRAQPPAAQSSSQLSCQGFCWDAVRIWNNPAMSRKVSALFCGHLAVDLDSSAVGFGCSAAGRMIRWIEVSTTSQVRHPLSSQGSSDAFGEDFALASQVYGL